MADQDPSDKHKQVEDLARMIYLEVRRQIDANWPANAAIIEAGSLRNVLIEGHIDLMRIAAALTTRYDMTIPDIETVGETRNIGERKRPALPEA